MNAKENYRLAYRNERMRMNNRAHSITDRFDYRYHNQRDFVNVPEHIQDAAHQTSIEAMNKFHGWVTGNGRAVRAILSTRRQSGRTHIPHWLRQTLQKA